MRGREVRRVDGDAGVVQTSEAHRQSEHQQGGVKPERKARHEYQTGGHAGQRNALHKAPRKGDRPAVRHKAGGHKRRQKGGDDDGQRRNDIVDDAFRVGEIVAEIGGQPAEERVITGGAAILREGRGPGVGGY